MPDCRLGTPPLQDQTLDHSATLSPPCILFWWPCYGYKKFLVILFSDTDEEELNRLAEAAVSGHLIIQKGEGNVLFFCLVAHQAGDNSSASAAWSALRAQSGLLHQKATQECRRKWESLKVVPVPFIPTPQHFIIDSNTIHTPGGAFQWQLHNLKLKAINFINPTHTN